MVDSHKHPRSSAGRQPGGTAIATYYKYHSWPSPRLYIQEKWRWRSYAPDGSRVGQGIGPIPKAVRSRLEKIDETEAEMMVSTPHVAESKEIDCPRPAKRHRNLGLSFLIILLVGACMALEVHDRRLEYVPDLVVPGTTGPFDWGVTFSDRTPAGAYWMKITVGAPVADTGPNSADGAQVVHCDVTMENSSQAAAEVSTDDFLMWETLEAGPLRPLGDAHVASVGAGESVTFGLQFAKTDATKSGCVTHGGPLVASNPEDSGRRPSSYLQWGRGNGTGKAQPSYFVVVVFVLTGFAMGGLFWWSDQHVPRGWRARRARRRAFRNPRR
jgi:hypothetical protein